MSERLAWLEEALVTSREMLSRAESARWDELPELMKQRDAAIQAALHEIGDAGAAGPEVLEFIEQIRILNDRLVALSVSERDRVERELVTVSTGKKAQKAYASGDF